KTDHALDVIGRIVFRQLEDDDVAALRPAAEDAARKRDRAEGKRILAVAVGIFRHEKIVADEQRGLHRTRPKVERLKQKTPDHERNQERMKADAEKFRKSAFLFFLSGHGHNKNSVGSPFSRARIARAFGPGNDSECDGVKLPGGTFRSWTSCFSRSFWYGRD